MTDSLKLRIDKVRCGDYTEEDFEQILKEVNPLPEGKRVRCSFGKVYYDAPKKQLGFFHKIGEIPPRSVSFSGRKFATFYSHYIRSLGSYYKPYMIKARLKRDRIPVVVRSFINAIRYGFLTNIGGVYIEPFGYFCHIMRGDGPRKVKSYKRFLERNGLHYFPTLITPPNARLVPYRFLLSDGLRKLSSSFYEKGFRYKFFFKEVFDLRYVDERGMQVLRNKYKNYWKRKVMESYGGKFSFIGNKG